MATKSSAGLTAIGAFLTFAAAMAVLAGSTLVFPGSPLDAMWRLNRAAYAQMAPLGKIIGIPMLCVSVVIAIAAVGCFRRCRWGWLLAVVVIATQVLGDIGNLVMGRLVEGAVGVMIAGPLLWYLLRPSVRSSFATPR